MAFGETNVPANETGSVVQYGSGSSTRNMLFAFTKTNVNTSFLGNDGTQMMLGTESTAPITFRTGLSYTAANIMGSGTEAMRITSSGVGIGTTTPSTKLHIVGTNPLTLTGVQAGTNTSADSLLTITNGLVRKLPLSTFANAYTSGNLTETSSNILTITGGTNAVLGSGATVQVKQSSGSQNGYLSSTDWTTFNNKLSSVDTSNITNFYQKVRGLFSATAPLAVTHYDWTTYKCRHRLGLLPPVQVRIVIIQQPALSLQATTGLTVIQWREKITSIIMICPLLLI